MVMVGVMAGQKVTVGCWLHQKEGSWVFSAWLISSLQMHPLFTSSATF